MPLLADQILAKGVTRDDGINRAIGDAIRSAHIFDLDGAFAVAVDQLRSSRPSSFRNVIPLCRLPYDRCWFEVSHTDRSSFVNGETHPGQDPAAVDRIGVLVEVSKDNDRQWNLSLFWSFVDGRVSTSHFDSVISFEDAPHLDVPHTPPRREILELQYRGKEIDEAYALYSRIGVRPGRFLKRDFANLHPTSVLYRALFKQADTDWAGEATFWMAAVALLNARNVADRDEVDNEAYNRRRRRLGSKRPPLLSYSRCVISARLRARMAEAQADGEPLDTRAHFVRGHIKARSTGLYWWSPFIRGNKRLGYVHKTFAFG